MLLKSRNTMVISAVVFLIVVILLRLSGGFLGDNVERIVGAIFAGNAENIPLLDFSGIDWSKLNPANWSFDDVTGNFNEWLHDMIDVVAPAMINMMTMAMVNIVAIVRADMLSATIKIARFVP